MTLHGRQIELWVEAREGRPAVNPIMRALLGALEQAGANTAVRVPEREIADPMRLTREAPPDLVLLKSATTLALSLAVADEAHGVRFLNGALTTLRAHDKAATVARLAAAGLPTPPTWLRGMTHAPADLPHGSSGGWVVKPVRGVHGRGVTTHATLVEALAVPAEPGTAHGYVVDDGTRLMQACIGGDEPDLKVYVAGERIFAGYKRFSAESYASNAIAPLRLDDRIVEVVLAAGATLDLRCFGVDLRFEGDRPVIIDANPFPGYRGFPDAVNALLREIEQRLGEDR